MGRPNGVPGVIGRPYPRAGSGNEAILGGQEWSAGAPRRLGVIERPSRRARSGNETLLEYREWLGRPFVCPQNLPEIFHASARPSVNFRQLSGHLQDLPFTFRASAELPSNFVSFSCVRGNFEKFRTAIGSSVNFSHLSVQSRDFPSTFCASTEHSVNFRQLSVHARNCLLTFCASGGPSVNFSQLSCGSGTYRQLSVHPRTFH